MRMQARRKTPTVNVGGVLIGSDHPVVVQSMTDTPTADVERTLAQILELSQAGSQLVRITINDAAAARAVPELVRRMRDSGCDTPLVGDFHFNGHTLLRRFPECARALAKYRINPGNVGRGQSHDDNFAQIIQIAIDNDKPVRIGVNWGSLDQELLTSLMDENGKRDRPKDFREVAFEAMIQSALESAALAVGLGLGRDRIILSAKMSILQDMVTVYSMLAGQTDLPLHLGLTEAGGDVQGVSSSSAALAILLQQGIGDTVRVSLTPRPGVPRSREVEVCKALLQSMGLRYFQPSVTSCPGCGRTSSDYFQHLARDVDDHIRLNMPLWRKAFPGVEEMKVAVMGCVVNGPGESRHADIGISLPGASEEPVVPVYEDGKKTVTLKGERIKEDFIAILENYIKRRYSKPP